MQLHARHYRTGKPIQISIVGNVIGSVTDSDRPAEDLPWVAPAFFDPQINGYGGTWFSNADITPRAVLEALRPWFGFGVSRLFPTLITASHETLKSGFLAIRRACDMEPWANELVAGCHLEGPFISSEDGPRGAHPALHVRAANWDEFQELQDTSGGRIRLVTLAPEVEGAIDFIKKAVASGVAIAIGHTAATTNQIKAAVDAGASISTHLGNGAHQVLPRHPNYIWDQLADSRLMASVIADGFHLPDSVLKCVLAVKGTNNVMLTCDASGLAGCDPGNYDINDVGVSVAADKRISLRESPELLAGSGASTLDCVRYLAKSGIASLADTIDMAAQTAARALGVSAYNLNRGQRADLIVFQSSTEDPISIVVTMAAGAIRYSKN
jgi:N-acetylglucosamine-6-phosphate deacetylase